MKHLKRLILLIACCLFNMIAGAQQTNPVSPRKLNTDSLRIEMVKQKKAVARQFAKVQLRSMIINTTDGKFGYYIFADGQMLIEQKTIPALPGNSGFANKEDAQKTASLAIKKIKAGEMPPTITVKELKKMKITAVFPKE